MKGICTDRLATENAPCYHYLRTIPGEAGLCLIPSRFRCVEALASELPSLTYSSISAWMQCKMRYYYHYILGIRVHDRHLPVAIKRGSTWDSFIEHLNPEDAVLTADRVQLNSDDRCKIQALIRAFQTLNIKNPIVEPQCQIFYTNKTVTGGVITGFLDNALLDGFDEYKLSTRPSYYLTLSNIYHQCGTYLLAKPNFQYVDMKVATLPKLERRDNEPDDVYSNRVFQDVISRPSFYFSGYNFQTKAWGKRFWRNEFDLAYIERTYSHIFRELRDTIDNDGWYMNKISCENMTGCMFKAICETGGVSEELYYYENPREAVGR